VKAFVSKVRGLLAPGSPAGPPIAQMAGPPDVMLQGAAQTGGVIVPVSVPAKTTWHVEGVQEIGLPPLFLMEMEMAEGGSLAVGPDLTDAPTTMMLEVVVALVTRL